jgi:hypothetical protein
VAASAVTAARRAPERPRRRPRERKQRKRRMALFRKFFLKKTPDRLLEISERVYGIMPASLGRARPLQCGICREAAFSGGDFGVCCRFLGFGFFWGSAVFEEVFFLSWNPVRSGA